MYFALPLVQTVNPSIKYVKNPRASQMESVKKRLRSTNWSEQEKKLLRKLVLERAFILEDKNTSTKTNTAKKAAWREVLSCFNAVSTNKRDMCQLLTQWRNMKSRSKKKDFTYRRQRPMARGKPSPPIIYLEDQESVEAEATANDCRIDNPYESDIINITQQDVKPIIVSTVPVQQQLLEPLPLPQCTINVIQPEDNNIQPICDSPFTEVKQEIIDFDEVVEESPVDTCARRSPTQQGIKRRKRIFKPNCCGRENTHDHKLFLISKQAQAEAMQYAKEAHDRKMEYEREVHEKRMAIMALEEEYLRLKIQNIKTSS